MTRTESLLAHVRAHITGVTPESLVRAGFHPWEIERQVRFTRLRRASDGRLHFIYRDPIDEGSE